MVITTASSMKRPKTIVGTTRVKLRTQRFIGVILIVGAVYLWFLHDLAIQVQQKQANKDPSELKEFPSSDTVSQLVHNTRETQKEQRVVDYPPTNATQNGPTNSQNQQKESKHRKRIMRPNFRPNPHGHMVEPQILLPNGSKELFSGATNIGKSRVQKNIPEDQILTAYLEPIDTSTWDIKPLPVRNVQPEDLTVTRYPKLNSCFKLPEQWPVDDYPDDDPFLPWIHDVFPTEDGKYIQFVAQNKQRCHTGTTEEEEAILEHTMPQMALFQHVALKKVGDDSRYRLSSHEDADLESISTRFICKFKPSGDITFSEFNNDYEWVSVRKGQRTMFQKDGRNNRQIHTSQLLFKCPVPDHLVDTVRTGASVIDDWATIFVDLIPVRTPPRFGPPDEFLVPKYSASMGGALRQSFDPHAEWGEYHILPPLEYSGRWANIPICKPSLLTYEPTTLKKTNNNDDDKVKKHHLVSCLWASTGYATRGNRYAINDGQRRMLEWITFNKMLGFDHFYIFDNTGAFSNESSLQPFEDIFPGDVTVINWPSRVCNNNPNNVDSVGERSSQYAAESSCRLRFGPHTNWIGQFDIDEYLVPMGNYTSVLQLLEKLDQEGKKIISFASWRAWPRRTHINNPDDTTFNDKELCSRRSQECFELSVRDDTTLMEAYNCDRQQPGKKTSTMPAEKQIYRASYVQQHFIHYSTVTETSNMPLDEYKKVYNRARPFPDPQSRFIDEVNEGLMLHAKAIARQDTAGWKRNCHKDGSPIDQCRIGFPWPEDGSNRTYNEDGWNYNCYVNPRIDNYWAPLLKNKLKEMGFL
ncbi:glycosyltransferase family 92 protein [Nitzschia inconspicua]|uniref:Glycosyltransferase family 92 protein n=1 Tax=Nitzschia inconspicua TaxID=303405 RepID=A0A9K3KNP9_9STRA|nr:glycosyltransferase family 92 protein [Nitzschia inconspicua]